MTEPRTLARAFLQRLTLLLLPLVAGCGNSDGASEPNGQAGASSTKVSCVTDARVSDHASGLQKPGARGVFSFAILSSDPEPPAKGTNTFRVQVLDSDGNAIDANVGVALSMPDHGHSTSVEPKVELDASTHVSSLSSLYLFMPGVWKIELSASMTNADGEDVADSATFYFCVQG